MITESDRKKTKNFKDIKKSIINTKTVSNENQSELNLESGPQSLSFKKLNTNRQEKTSFVSPTKVFAIDTYPIQNIDLSSQKKKQLFLKYKPSNYQKKQTRQVLNRNDSTNSNKSDNSYKKSLYSQFSQLAQASSQQRKSKPLSNNLCFNKLDKKSSESNLAPRKSNLANIKPTTPTKQILKQMKPTQTKIQTLTPKLRKHQSNTIVEIKQRNSVHQAVKKSAQKSENPPTIRQESMSTLRQALCPSLQFQSIGIKESVYTIEDSVRISVDLERQLDMSPFL